MTNQKSYGLGLILFALVAGSTAALFAQQPKPAGTTRPRQERTGPVDSSPGDGRPDVVVRRVDGGDLGPGNLVRFRVANRGFGPMGWGTAKIFIGETPVAWIFRENASYGALGQGQEVIVTARSATPEPCRDNWVRVLVSGATEESNVANNELSWQLARLCPDLGITGLKQNWEDRNTRYRVHVTVTNIHNLRMLKPVWLAVDLWEGATAVAPESPTAPSQTDFAIRVGPLNPGESVSVNVGPKRLATQRVCAEAWVDSLQELKEQLEDNNHRVRCFGPH